MAAGPIGSVWASGSWTDTCWEANTWATAAAVLSPYVHDFTMAVNDRLVDLRAAAATPDLDSTSLLRTDVDAAQDGRDLNTAYWTYLTQ